MHNSNQLLTDFENHLRAEQLSPRTISTYLSLLKKYLNHFQCKPKRISAKQIIDYLAEIQSPVTRKQARAVIGKLHFMLGQPRKMKGVPKPKQPQRVARYLNEAEIAQVLNALSNLKHRAILTLMYAGALRVSELLNLRVCDINGHNSTVKICQSKGAKDRVVPLPPETLQLLRSYYRAYRPGWYLFAGPNGKYSATSVNKVLASALNKCGLSGKITAHGLRHSRATHLINQGVDVKIIKEFLGHRKIETTEKYLHCAVNNIADQIRQADSRITSKLLN